jgi:hypothetical protein
MKKASFHPTIVDDTDMAEGTDEENHNMTKADEENDWDIVSIDSYGSFIYL